MKIKSLTNRDDTNFEIMDFGGVGAATTAEPIKKKEHAPKIEKKEQPGKMTNEQKKKKKEEEKASRVEGHELGILYKKE